MDRRRIAAILVLAALLILSATSFAATEVKLTYWTHSHGVGAGAI